MEVLWISHTETQNRTKMKEEEEKQMSEQVQNGSKKKSNPGIKN